MQGSPENWYDSGGETRCVDANSGGRAVSEHGQKNSAEHLAKKRTASEAERLTTGVHDERREQL